MKKHVIARGERLTRQFWLIQETAAPVCGPVRNDTEVIKEYWL